MWDPPQGRVADVERLLQVLALLRASELGVSRTALLTGVQAYAAEHAAALRLDGAQQETALASLVMKARRDLRHLEGLGFRIDDLAAPGAESVFVLRPTPWRLPVDLDEQEQAVLSWVMRTAGAAAPDEDGVPPELRTRSYDALLGALPRSLGLVHAALAGGRRLVVDRAGREEVVEPVQLAAHEGRWYLLVRYPGTTQVYGYRLDRLQVERLGDPMSEVPPRVDPVQVLDPTAWRKHDPVDVEVRCAADDLAVVRSWFPRATVEQVGCDAVLRFAATHVDAVLDRVIGLAGAARLCGPPSAVADLRARLLPFAGDAA